MEWKRFTILLGVFLTAYFVPFQDEAVQKAILNAFTMLQWYAVNHTLGCVVPAMFIAGAIAVFLSKESVLKFLGPKSRSVTSYGVASVAGVLLAVCSCSVLPMFAGIYRVGAGLGPASTFLCSGPALNVMAIFLSARVLGWNMGCGRTFLAILMSLGVGLAMAWIFRRKERERIETVLQLPEPPMNKRRTWQTGVFLATMVAFLIFSDWVPSENYPWSVRVFEVRGWICLGLFLAVLGMTWRWFERAEIQEWMSQTWSFARSIVPLLFGGVFVTGFLTALLPAELVARYVGGNTLSANLISSVLGVLWYFSTLSEIPMLQSLMELGMGRGPAMTLLLAGPTLSLPSLVVLWRYLGAVKTLVFTLLVIIFSTTCGMLFGMWF